MEIFVEGDLPPVDDDTLKKDKISFEEAIAAQYRELEQEQQPPAEDAGEPYEEPAPQAVEETAPEASDKPDEVGVPETEEQMAEEAADDDEYLFEVDGYRVRDVAEAKNGWMFQKDYTKKTTELAEERKQYENLMNQVQQEREKYIAGYARARQLDEALYKEPDWITLQAQDPEGYIEARENWDQIQARRLAMDEEIRLATEQQQAAAQEKLRSHYVSESEKLLNRVPEWREKKVAEEFFGQVNEYLSGYEFTPEEISNITDHRLMLVLRDAVQGRTVRKNGAAPIAQKKVAKARKGLSGAPRQAPPDPNASRLNQARENLSRDGSFEDAIELQLAEMGLPYDDGVR